MAGRREVDDDSETQRQLSSKLHNHPHFLLDDSISNQTRPALKYSNDEILTMIKVVLDLHDNNISLSSLDSSNIVRGDDWKLKFRGLALINSSSPQTRKNDFKLLARLIEDSLKRFYPNLDMIYKDLIQQMCDYRDSDRDLLLNHLLFKPLPEQIAFFRNAFERRAFSSGDDQNKYKQVLKQMDSIMKKQKKDWRQEIRESDEKGVKKCFEFQPEPRPVNYQDTTFSKLQFCRNLAMHLPQHLREAGVPKDEILSETCRIIFKHFGKELLTFQMLAHKEGILEHFMPGYTPWTPTTQTQRQDYNRSDNVGGGGGGGGQGTHQYRTQPTGPVKSSGGTKRTH